jgi:hypothetical protein
MTVLSRMMVVASTTSYKIWRTSQSRRILDISVRNCLEIFDFFFIVAPVAMYFIYEQFVDIMIEPSSPR